MDESAAPLAEATKDQDGVEAPRLRLHHFFLLFVVTSFVLAVSRSMMDRIRASATGVQIPQPGIAIWTIGTVVLGGQITVSALAVVWRRRMTIRLIQPGEWLSLITATESSVSILWWALFFPVNSGFTPSSFLWLTVIMSCLQLFWSVLLVLLLVRSRENVFWKAVYAVLLNGQLLALLMSVLPHLLTGSNYFTFMNSYGRILNSVGYLHWLIIPAICAAVVVDRRQQRERRWTHWLGVMLYLTEVVLQIVMALWATYVANAGGGTSPNPPASSP